MPLWYGAIAVMTPRYEARLLAGSEQGLCAPSGLAFRRGELLIADMNNQRIARLTRQGAAEEFSGCPPLFSKPLALAADRDSLWVADAANPALWRWQAGKWSRAVTSDSLPGGLSLPGGVALIGGEVYFTDFLKNRVCRRTMQGGCEIVETIRCVKPYGICAQGGEVYLTDTGRGRILRYSPREEQCAVLLEQPAEWNPIALAASSDGWLYISTGRTLWRYHRTLGELEPVVDAATWRSMGLGKLCHLGAIAAKPGRVVVSDTIRHTVVELFSIL